MSIKDLNMIGPHHICVVYVATAGVQGPLMGSDEQEIVLLIYVIIDVLQNKIIGVQQYPIRPTNTLPLSTTPDSPNCDTPDGGPLMIEGIPTPLTSTTHSNASSTHDGSTATTDLILNENNNILSEQVTADTTLLTDDLLKSAAARPLDAALADFAAYCAASLHLDPHQPGFRLVTDGQLPLRQCLHPEAYRKDIDLPFYYSTFHDLRKEVARHFGTYMAVALPSSVKPPPPPPLPPLAGSPPAVAIGAVNTITTVATLGGATTTVATEKVDLTNSNNSSLVEDSIPQSIADMLSCCDLKPESENEFYKKEAKDMVNIVQKLISDGHRFDSPETVTLVLEPGICSKDDEIDGNCIVRARGLPWQSSDQDIAKFFRGLNVAKGGVALCLSPMGRRNGEALIRFESQEHRDMALKRHKHHIGNRYIEVYRATGEDFLSVAGGASCEAQAFLSRGATVIIRMRGLPYDCVAKQVLEFFASGENACTVLDGTDGVLFVRKLDGRATGDAFVLFANDTDAPKALSKHRESIGSRYIELFRSTTAEVQQVLNRSLDPKTYEQNSCPLIQQLPQVPLLPQHVITSGTRKDCIRLRGLPYEALVEHILDFLGDYAKNIIFQGVHMVYNAQGQPSGEAFIQMDSEQSAFTTAHQKHHRYMIFGKKQRYIEVFQCSGDDMNLVLTGALPASPLSPVLKAVAPSSVQQQQQQQQQQQGQQPPPPPSIAAAVAAASLLSPGGSLISTAYHPAAGNYPGYGPPMHAGPPPRQFYPPPPIFYWPYPSPPVSPTGYYTSTMPPNVAGMPPPQQQPPPSMIPTDCLPLPALTGPMTPMDAARIMADNMHHHQQRLLEHDKACPTFGNQFTELFI